MARLTPDPTFYASPAAAAEAPQETLAYVVTLNEPGNGPKKPDALTVLDLQPGSSTYGQLVSRLEMPNVGDELHHFGWNACSSALCPWAPHPHVARRYLLVPGLRSSRIHVVDVENPHEPKFAKVIEAEEIASKTGYSRPHTVHCGPDGIYVSALGNPEGDGPGGIFLLDHDSFDVKGSWEADRGPQELAYDFWWHLNYGTVITSEWGTPKMVEDGLVGELLLGNQYGHKLHVFDLDKRTHLQEIDLGAENQMVLELRPAHDPRKAYGFVGVVVSTADLSASVWLWERAENGTASVAEGHHDPAGAGRGRTSCRRSSSRSARCRRSSPTSTSRSTTRSLYVSCWGTGELKRYDVTNPRAPRETGSVKLGGIVERAAHPRPDRSTAGRRWSRSAATASASTSRTRSTTRGTSSSTRTGSTAGSSSSTPARTAR